MLVGHQPTACDSCLRRTWLLARLSGHLDVVRSRIGEVLALGDDELIAGVAGRQADAVRRDLEAFIPDHARAVIAEAGMAATCRCDLFGYPWGFKDLAAPPAVLHVLSEAFDDYQYAVHYPAVAIVGARRPSEYGVEVAAALGRDLAAAGITVISGLAFGIDTAAHRGALERDGATVAVMPGGADLPYPSRRRALHQKIATTCACVSELPPGTPVRSWMFPARNRIIAALATACVVVEAGERSGSLVTVAAMGELDQPVGAVPGRVSSPLAAGPNAMLAEGARVIRDAGDVFELLADAGAMPRADAEGRRVRVHADHAGVPEELAALLDGIASGADTVDELVRLFRKSRRADEVLAGVAALELSGHVRRGAGGRLTVVL
jgi:DNA processing protein